jgi:hypothetical protein
VIIDYAIAENDVLMYVSFGEECKCVVLEPADISVAHRYRVDRCILSADQDISTRQAFTSSSTDAIVEMHVVLTRNGG